MWWAFAWYSVAALSEIGGCFCFWSWIRLGRSPILALLGMASLALFALALTRVETENAGRAFAAYGGVYIVGSLLWLWFVEAQRPDRWDLVGAGLCLLGSAIILLTHRPG